MWLLLLAGCTGGERGARGGPGAPCTATGSEAGWEISCPDGSTATLPPSGCTESEGAAGTRIIRCGDGTEAVIRGPEELHTGAIAGIASLEGRGPADGVLVEVVGTSLQVVSTLDGSFVLAGVPAGRHAVRLSHPGFQEVVIPDVELLPGTRELGPITLAFAPAIDLEGELFVVHPASQRAVLAGWPRSRAEVRDLVTGEVLASLAESVSYAHWIDGRHLWLESRNLGPPERSLFDLETGTQHRWSGWLHISVAPGAILVQPSSGENLRIRWTDGETDLGAAPSGSWVRVADRSRWLISSGDGVWLVDGDERSMRQLETQPAARVRVDNVGSLVVVEQSAPGGTRLVVHDVDLGFRHDLGVFPGGPPSVFEDRTFVWWSEDGVARAVLAGEEAHRAFPDAIDLPYPSPRGTLFLVLTSAGTRIESRSGDWSRQVGPLAETRPSLSERRVGFFEDGNLHVVDRETLETRSWPVARGEIEWLGEADLLVHQDDESHHVRWSDERVRPLGSPASAEVIGDWLLSDSWTGDDNRLLDLRTGTFTRIPRNLGCMLAPNGVWLVCTSDQDRLRLRHVESGATYRLGGDVRGVLALEDVVVYQAAYNGRAHPNVSLPYP